MEIKQGDIYWVTIPQNHTVGSEQYKRRPYIIVSRTAVNRVSRTVVGVPMSSKTQKAGNYRILVPIGEIIKEPTCTDHITDSVALTDHIRVLDITRLEQPRIGRLSTTAVIGLGLGIAFLFDIR